MTFIKNLHTHYEHNDKEVRVLGIVKIGDFRSIPSNMGRICGSAVDFAQTVAVSRLHILLWKQTITNLTIFQQR